MAAKVSQGVNDDALAHFDPFLRVAAVAWDYLDSPERKVIRASCRSGLLLHDRLLTHLSMAPVATGEHPATPQQIASAVAAAISRGARLHSCNIVFVDLEAPPAAREEQLLAFLAACSHPSVTMLGLEGAMPLSLQIINAMSTLSPNLTTLSLSFSDNDLPGPAEAPMYGAAVHHLMFALGGRLQQLQLLHVHDWPLSAFVGLRHACTALTKLEIMAGDEQRDADILEGGPWAEACLLDCVSGLTSLQSLTLHWRLQHDASPAEWRGLGAEDHEPAHVHTTHLLRLSTLTNLRELDLVAPHHRRFDLKWDQELQHSGPDLAHCRAVWAEQRASLLAALRAMPRLRALHCPHMYFEGSELAALTSLGALSIGGFIPSFVADQMRLAPEDSAGYAVAVAAAAAAADPAAAPGRTTAPITLPPKLEILHLAHGGFLSALVAIQPPPSLRTVNLGRSACDRVHLHFSTTTSREGYGLVPSTAADFRRAAELLSLCHVPAAHRPVGRGRELSVVGSAAPDALQGPAGEVGHGRWLRELQPLGLKRLVLTNLQLELGDLLVIAESLEALQVLAFDFCVMPLALLPCLARLQQLRELWVMGLGPGGPRPTNHDELCAALLLLCVNAPSLAEVHLVDRMAGPYGGDMSHVLRELAARGKGHVEIA